MKKIYLSILASAFSFQIANAQLTLTKAANEPVLGDVHNSVGLDSAGVIPKNTGAGQVWNMSTLISNTNTASSNYTTVASTPSAAAYAAATIAEAQGAGTFNYWKSTATQYEYVGAINPTTGFDFNFSANPAIAALWPIGMGYSNTSAFNGTCSITGFSGTAAGTMKTNATGTGTLQLPGGIILTNVLQVKITQTINVNVGSTFTVTQTEWRYYHSSQKFEILSIIYQDIQGAFTNSSSSIFENAATLTTGIKENNVISNYLVYPSPVSDKLNVSLSNSNSETVSVQILNNMGQLVKSENLGDGTVIQSAINVSDLAKGIYFVKTSVGTATSTKKIIIE